MTLSAIYTHQYYADLGVNDPRGGSVSPASGWLQAGTSLHATELSNPQWQFQRWTGSGVGAYSGSSPTIDVAVMGPLTEKAAFYVQLAIEADRGTSITYSYGSETGGVQAGTTKTIYVPPSSNVTLRASPSIFVYSFASWEGNGILSDSKPLLSLAVDSPTAVIGTSAYNFPVILIGAVAILVVVLAGSVWIRGRGGRNNLTAFSPSTTST